MLKGACNKTVKIIPNHYTKPDKDSDWSHFLNACDYGSKALLCRWEFPYGREGGGLSPFKSAGTGAPGNGSSTFQSCACDRIAEQTVIHSLKDKQGIKIPSGGWYNSPWGHCRPKPNYLSPRTGLWLNLMAVREFVQELGLVCWVPDLLSTLGSGSCTSAVVTKHFLLQETLKAEGRKLTCSIPTSWEWLGLTKGL